MPNYRNINIRLTPEEAQLVDEFQARLQGKYGSEIRVTQRTVIVHALKVLARTLTEGDNEPTKRSQHPEQEIGEVEMNQHPPGITSTRQQQTLVARSKPQKESTETRPK